MEALERARLHADAVAESLVAEIGAPGPRGDGHPRGGTRGEPHLPVTEEGDRPDVALAEAVGAHGLEARLGQLLARERDRQVEDVSGTVQPVHVLAEAEDRGAAVVALVAADALEDRETIVERVREHMHLRLVPGDEPAIEPDALGLLHPASS